MLVELIIFGFIFAVILAVCLVIGVLVATNIMLSKKYMQKCAESASYLTKELEKL